MIASHFPEQAVLDKLRNKVYYDTSELEWPNVIVTSSYKKYMKSVPESSFSIFVNKNGEVKLNNNKRDVNIYKQRFYLSNPFASFDYEINSEETVDTLNIHHNYTFYSEALYALLNSNENLLDYPDDSNTSYTFMNQLHYKSPYIKKLSGSLHQKEEEVFLLEFLEYCLSIDRKDRSRILIYLSVSLPVSISEILKDVDYIFLTHLHPDHFDTKAQETIPKSIPFVVQPSDLEKIEKFGFKTVEVIDQQRTLDNVEISRVDALHGGGKILHVMGVVSGYIVKTENEAPLCITGDTIWCDTIKSILDKFNPGIIICNAGGNIFLPENNHENMNRVYVPEDGEIIELRIPYEKR
jgi:hypothetical protein